MGFKRVTIIAYLILKNGQKMDSILDYQLYLFDFDGLLVDTEQLHYTAYMEMARRQGFPLTWDYRRFRQVAHSKPMGFFDGWQKEHPRALEGTSKEVLYEEKKRLYVELLQKNPLELMEGAEELIDALDAHGIKSAVVTNSPKGQIELIKQALPTLQKIPLWITREDYAQPKPSPEGYLKAISLLAKPGDKIIGFEDALKGLKALLAAGADAVLICPRDLDYIGEAKSLGAKHFESLSTFYSYLTPAR
jgi:beta-phosphoglucomutase